MLTQHEHTVLLNLIAEENSLAPVYAFLEKTLQENSGYKHSDRELSRRLIAHLDSLNEEERRNLLQEAHRCMQSPL